MKYLFLALLTCVILAYSLSAMSAERYLSHYEVNVDDSAGVKTVRTSCYFTPGTPVVHELGGYTLTLAIAVGADNQYTLAVDVAKPATGTAAPVTLLRQSFNGQLADRQHGPMEFKLQRDSLSVNGAFVLAAPDQ